MSCMISRRNFMRCVGIGALALASGSLLGGCTQFGGEYGLGRAVTWTDESGKIFSMEITEVAGITDAMNPNNLAKKYQLKLGDGQRYIFLRFKVRNDTDSTVDLYEPHSDGIFSFIKTEYTDKDIQDYFYTREKVAEGEEPDQYPNYPNANNIVEAPSVIWAYQDGMEMNRENSQFGVICYNSGEGDPVQDKTYAKIPTGLSYIDCIGQVKDDFQVLRLVYRNSKKEVNFKLTSEQFGL